MVVLYVLYFTIAQRHATDHFGQARFRVYGHVMPVFPAEPSAIFDLAHVFAGGQVIFTSDQHFGVGSNLILPGRGDALHTCIFCLH